MNENKIAELQKEAKDFIKHNILLMKNIIISPKEIEVYYYKEGEFEDKTVHRNDLQKNNKNHFYVHRWGTAKCSPYKGGNYPGLDYVFSDNEDTYYSYLIRSAVINNEGLIIGPNKVLNKICEIGNVSFENLEKETLKLSPNDSNKEIPVLFSARINLCTDGKKKSCDSELKLFCDSELRAVLCDDLYVSAKYQQKENMIINFLTSNNNEDKPKNPIEFCKEKLNCVPSKIKEYYGYKN